MSKTFRAVLTGAIVILIILASYALTTNVYSDTRDVRDRGTVGRTVDPAPTPTPPVSPSPSTPPSSGGITSSTSGTVNTGSNTGGQVTTGDEYVEIYEINIGPTNSPPSPDEEDEVTPPVTEPPCGSDARSRTTCPTDNTRTR